MQKIVVYAAVFLVFCCRPCVAQTEGPSEETPAGMEKVQVGKGAEVVVPRGTKVSKKGDLIVLESANEYVARKMLEVEERLARIEQEQKALRQQLEELSATVEEMKERMHE